MSSPSSLTATFRALVLGAVTVLSATGLTAEEMVKLGILHSLSGTMAISEVSCKDASVLAIEEINAKGGVLGKKLEPVIVDGASKWPLFAEKAKELLLTHKVAATFGCWTSSSRKSVLPVFEENNGLLFYPVQYEGEEQSLNVFYTAASPNQQLVPAAEYMMEQGAKKFVLLGTDYVFPRTANLVLKEFLKSKGVPDANILEEYTQFGHKDYQTIVAKIKELSKGGGACVLSTINGDSNVPFYKEFANQGLTSSDCPIMAFSVAEDELRAMEVPPLVGHLAAWNYFMSIDTPENKSFIASFQAKYGKERVTDDPIEAAYYGVYVWKAAVEKAKSFEVEVMLNLLKNALDAQHAVGLALAPIEVQFRAEAGSWHITVRDCGCGLEPEQFRHLFEPFFTTKPEGLGLGLSLSKGMIESLGGTLSAVNNDENAGLAVSFSLPQDESSGRI